MKLRLWGLSLVILMGILSCASQPQVAAPERSQEPKAAAKAPAQAPEAAKPPAEKGVPYLSGGIGIEERNKMREAAKAYNLALMFAGKSRHYVTDVQVVIADDKGKQILSADSSGPWLYVQLSPGVYTVKATYKGKVKEIKNLRLAKSGNVQRTIFWDVD